MYGILLAIHAIVSILLILIILMQQKGGGMGAAFGGGGQSVFGGRGANPFLTKTTVVLFAMFIIISFSIAFMSRGRAVRKKESAIEKAINKGDITPPTQSYPAQPYEGE